MKEPVQNRIGTLLKASGKTLGAAESCTGGQISHLLTTVSGSSAYYLGSVTSYAAAVKESPPAGGGLWHTFISRTPWRGSRG